MACPECGSQQTFWYEEPHPEPDKVYIFNLCIDPSCGTVDRGVVVRGDDA